MTATPTSDRLFETLPSPHSAVFTSPVLYEGEPDIPAGMTIAEYRRSRFPSDLPRRGLRRLLPGAR